MRPYQSQERETIGWAEPQRHRGATDETPLVTLAPLERTHTHTQDDIVAPLAKCVIVFMNV